MFKLILCINILVWYRYIKLWCNLMFWWQFILKYSRDTICGVVALMTSGPLPGCYDYVCTWKEPLTFCTSTQCLPNMKDFKFPAVFELMVPVSEHSLDISREISCSIKADVLITRSNIQYHVIITLFYIGAPSCPINQPWYNIIMSQLKQVSHFQITKQYAPLLSLILICLLATPPLCSLLS